MAPMDMKPTALSNNETTCYTSASIVLTVILTAIVTVILSYAILRVWRRWQKKRTEHLILENDPEKEKGQYAFDNPGFKEPGVATSAIHTAPNTNSKFDSSKKWTSWSPLTVLALTKNEKQKKTTVDDSAIHTTSHSKVVSLQSNEFTKMSIKICGNIKEGIFVKSATPGGAPDSKSLSPGDRIVGVAIHFEHIVYEDALSILSFASQYAMHIAAISASGQPAALSLTMDTDQPLHPMYKSVSVTSLTLHNEERAPIEVESVQKESAPASTSPSVPSIERLGVRVLPPCPRIERITNDNELEAVNGIDEIDSTHILQRHSVQNASGIRRDVNGIPQEIPSYMMSAAVAAQSNRKNANVDEEPQTTPTTALSNDSPRKTKQKAPSPPTADVDATPNDVTPSSLQEEIDVELERNLIHQQENQVPNGPATDSDTESTAASKKVELVDANDITIHTEPLDVQCIPRPKKRTASAGDLVPAVASDVMPNSSAPDDVFVGSFERAKSLDASMESKLSLPIIAPHLEQSDDISLNTDDTLQFQIPCASRLKKSSEWGTLEDALRNETDESMTSMTSKVKNQIWPHHIDDDEPEIDTTEVYSDIHIEIGSPTEDNRSTGLTMPSVSPRTSSLTGESPVNAEQLPPRNDIWPIPLEDPCNNRLQAEKNSNIVPLPTNDIIETNKPMAEMTDLLKMPKGDSIAISDVASSTNYEPNTNVPDDVKVSLVKTTDKIDHQYNYITEIKVLAAIPTENTIISDVHIPSSSLASVDALECNGNGPVDSGNFELFEQITSLTDNYQWNSSDHNNDKQHAAMKPLIDVDEIEKELNKIHEMAEQQLKKLPEMRFSTSTYNDSHHAQRSCKTKTGSTITVTENPATHHVEQLKHNFEKRPSSSASNSSSTVSSNGTSPKSRIPIATGKQIVTPPTSPERRDSRNYDIEPDRALLELMANNSKSYSKLICNNTGNKINNSHVTVTSIRSTTPTTKIPRPPIPPKRQDSTLCQNELHTNGATGSSSPANGDIGNSNQPFKQWVFTTTPDMSSAHTSSITSIVVDTANGNAAKLSTYK